MPNNGADYNKLEARQAKRDGATLVKNSGRGERKGDARKSNLLIDYKFTERGSFALNDKGFHKHYMDAYKEGFEGVVVAIFTETDHKVAIVNWQYLLDLQDELKYKIELIGSLEGELCELQYRMESLEK